MFVTFEIMKPNKKHVILALLLPLQIVLIQFLSQKSQWIESFYSNGIYPYISRFFRILLGWIPFSFGDLLGLILMGFIVYKIYLLFKNKFRTILSFLLGSIAFLSVLYMCFYVFWGLNYFRKPLSENLGLQQSKYTTEQLVSTTKKVIEILNSKQLAISKEDSIKVIVPYSNSEIYKKVPHAYEQLAKVYPQLAYKNVAIKNSLVSLFQSYNGTSGYLNPITGEAQVNSMITKPGFPATACHEVAHQIGWSAENEANFIGFLACVASEDIYFNYSGYRMAARYCLREVKKRDPALHKELWKTVNKGIKKELKENYEFWKQYENPIEPYLKKGYNSYLKANNQTKGIASYSYVVDLLIVYFEQSHL